MPTTQREQDENGFLLIKGCPISSYGIFDYSAGQLGLPGDPNRIVKVFRPESAVSDPAAIDSFKNVPLIDDHEMLSGFQGDKNTTAPEDYGIDGVLTGNVYYEAPWMRGDLKAFTRKLQAALQSGKKDLSLGYSCDFEVKPGVFNGQPYEVVQTNMRGNHIALVEEGRVPGARVLDGLCFDSLSFTVQPSEKEQPMKVKDKKAFDNALAQLKALLPALSEHLNASASGGDNGGEEGAEGGEAAQVGATGGAEGGAVAGEGAGAAEGGEAAGAGAEGAGAGAEGGEAAGAGAEGGESGGGEGVAALVTQVEALLAQLKAAVGETGGATDGENESEGENAADNVEGLNTETGVEGAQVSTDNGEGAGVGEGQGKASEGPAAGTHANANDAALRGFYADLASKTRLYDRLSKVVGAFDHAAMDSRQVAAYGVKKLGIKAAKGSETIALDAYLTGREAAAKSNTTSVKARSAADAAASSDMDAYLKGGK